MTDARETVQSNTDIALQALPLLINPKKASGFTGYYISEEQSVDSIRLGRLIVVVELRSREKSSEEFTSRMIDWLVKSFYEQSDSSRVRALEKTAQQFNEAIFEITGKTENWLSKVNIMLAMVHQESLAVAQSGNTTAWLVRNGQVKAVAAPEKNDQQSKVFTHIVSGAVKPADSLLFTTGSLFDFFSLEKIRTTISQIDILRSIELLGNLYPTHDAAQPLSLVLGTVAYAHELEPEPLLLDTDEEEDGVGTVATLSRKGAPAQPASASQSSMTELNSLESRTDKLLDPSRWIDPKRIKQKIRNALPFTSSSEVPIAIRTSSSEQSDPLLKRTKRILIALFVHPFIVLRKLVMGLAVFARNPREAMSTVRSSVTDKKEKGISRFRSFPLKHKAVLIVALVFIIVFIGSLAALSRRQIVTQRTEQLETQLATLEGKLVAAKAALIYQDEGKARRLIGESQELLDDFPSSSKGLEERLGLLSEDLDTLKESAFRRYNVDAQQLVDFASDAPGASTIHLVLHGERLISANMNSNAVLQYDLSTNQLVPPLEDAPLGGRIRSVVSLNEEELLVLHNNSSFYLLNTVEETWEPLDLAGSDSYEITSLTTYSDRIYLTDGLSSQVVRYSPAGSGYGRPQNWLKEPLATSIRSDMVIDGSVYISQGSSEILQYNRGTLERTLLLDDLEPELVAHALYTTDTLDNLYILDRTNNRVVALNKEDGTLDAQYVSDQFSDLQALTVNAQETTLYVLQGTQVLSFAINS